MSAKWQQWMPFHINRFKGSSAVQAMPPAARAGYLYLLSSQWESADGTISSDPFDLAEESGLGDTLWEQHGLRILRNFRSIDDNRLRNDVCFEEWCEAKRIFEARQESAKRTNQIRPAVVSAGSQEDKDAARKSVTEAVRKGNIPNANQVACVDCGHLGDDRTHDWDHYKGYLRDNWLSVQSVCRPCHTKREINRGTRWRSETVTVTDTVTEEPPSRSADTITLTGTNTKTEKPKKQKPSRSESGKPPDHRHQECKQVIRDYWDSKNPEIEMPWDGSEGKILGMFLSANPKLTAVGIGRLIAHRGNSEVNHADRPSKWIRSLTSFNQGPIDRFGKPIGLNGGNHNAAVPNGTGNKIVGIVQKSLEGTECEDSSWEDGDLPSGIEVGRSDASTIHASAGQFRLTGVSSSDEEYF